MNVGKVLGDRGISVCRNLDATGLTEKFYLADGTALALQLGHRRSFDFDFFQDSSRDTIESEQILKQLARVFSEERSKITLKQVDQLTVDLDGTKTTFLAYPFPILHSRVIGESLSNELAGLRLASPREIASMKAYAIGRRTTFRDYIDLYYLLAKGLVSLEQIVRDATRKFLISGQELFSTKLFLQQLTYTKDVDDKDASINLMVKERVSVREVEEFLQLKVAAFLNKKTASEEGPNS